MEEVSDSHMHGLKRVLNVKQLVKFPYPTSMIQSSYRHSYGFKYKLRVQPFNLEKENMYKRSNPDEASSSLNRSIYLSTARSAY